MKPLLGHDTQYNHSSCVCVCLVWGERERERHPSLAKTFVLVIDEGAKTVLMSTAAKL